MILHVALWVNVLFFNYQINNFTLGCDLLVHYGHSCLVPIQDTSGIHLLYVFVQIEMNLSDFINTIKSNFSKEQHLAFVSTIQFVASLQVNIS
jgi:2-(3-amino-3-carboxypropyl)histidine synthase